MQRNQKTTKNSSKARPGQSQNNNGNKKKKNPRPVRAVTAPNQNLLGLSECVLKYATAISDPWSPLAEGVCIPTFPSRASLKSTTFTRFTVSIGTGNVGWVAICPTLCNDQVCGFASTSTYAGGVGVAPGINSTTIAGSTLSQIVMSNNPFTTAQLTLASDTVQPTVSGRIVSVGVSVQYTGTKLNEGGLLYGLVHPNHGGIHSYTISQIAAFREACVCTTGSKKHWFTMAGQSEQEVQYPSFQLAQASDTLNALFPFSNGQYIDPTIQTIGGCPLMIYFTGTAANTFEVEIVQHAEYIGSAASNMATPSHSDAVGFQVVNTAAALVQQKATQKPGASRPSIMREAIAETLHSLRPVASFVGKSAYNLAKTPAGQAAMARAGSYALSAIL